MRSDATARLLKAAGTVENSATRQKLVRVALSVEDVRRFTTLKLINGSMEPLRYLFESLSLSAASKEDTSLVMDQLREVLYRTFQTIKIADVTEYLGPVDRLLTELQQGLKENTSAYMTSSKSQGNKVRRHMRSCATKIKKLKIKTSNAVPDNSYLDPGRSNPFRFLITYKKPYYDVRVALLLTFSEIFDKLSLMTKDAGFRYNYRRKLSAFSNRLRRARTKLMRRER